MCVAFEIICRTLLTYLSWSPDMQSLLQYRSLIQRRDGQEVEAVPFMGNRLPKSNEGSNNVVHRRLEVFSDPILRAHARFGSLQWKARWARA